MDPTPFPIERDETTAPGQLAGCVTIRLEQAGSPVVVLDYPLIRRLELTLEAIPAGTTGLVLASASARVFIAGADLKSIQDLPAPDLDRYLAYGQRVFGMLCSLPFPTVAAVNGAALGGGLELALHCDGLVAAPSASGKPYPVGLPEAGLSICPGWGGTNLLPARIDPEKALRMTAEGRTMPFEEAVSAGLFDLVAGSAADLLPTAKAWLAEPGREAHGRRDGEPRRWIGRVDHKARTAAAFLEVEGLLPATESAAAVASAVRAGLETGWAAALDIERRELTRLRGTPAGRAAITAFFLKSAKG